MKNKLNIVQEGKLCELVLQYAVILDKSHKDCKKKDVEENSWQGIYSALDFLSTDRWVPLNTISV